jgi:ABC-type nitrate/sulfonate/bicarbonate transport system substrate-binding protein
MTDSGPATLRLGYFSKSPILEVARQHGLLEAQGLRVEAEAVSSSPAQFRSLVAGDYDLVLTSPDNVAAYRFGTANPLGEQIDVRVVRAVDGGLGLSVLGGEGIGRVDDLRGRTVAVDVPESGFAFALYHLLAQRGLTRDSDYHVIALGATPRRAVALREGRCDATLLNAGATVAAELAGLVNLGRISAVVRPYLATVLAATGARLDADEASLRRFCVAWDQAVAALLDAARAAALTPLLADVFALPETQVAAMRSTLHDPDEGLIVDRAVDPVALHNVLDLRARYGSPDAAAAVRSALRGGIEASGIIERRYVRTT